LSHTHTFLHDILKAVDDIEREAKTKNDPELDRRLAQLKKDLKLIDIEKET